MKYLSILSLCLLLFFSCKTVNTLPTDGSKPIDISGGWNATDAEIAMGELYLEFQQSAWYKANIAGSTSPRKLFITGFNVSLNNAAYQQKVLKSELAEELKKDEQNSIFKQAKTRLCRLCL